jgi:hypothetical protein
MARKQRNLHDELERLKQDRVDAGVAHRAALMQLDLINGRIRALETEIRVLHSKGGDVMQAEQALMDLRHSTLPSARLREEGLRMAVEKADAERRTFVRDNLDKLLAELQPREKETMARFAKARREMIAADAAWRSAQSAREGLYRDDPDQLIMRQREPLPRHGYEDAIATLRRPPVEATEEVLNTVG